MQLQPESLWLDLIEPRQTHLLHHQLKLGKSALSSHLVSNMISVSMSTPKLQTWVFWGIIMLCKKWFLLSADARLGLSLETHLSQPLWKKSQLLEKNLALPPCFSLHNITYQQLFASAMTLLDVFIPCLAKNYGNLSYFPYEAAAQYFFNVSIEIIFTGAFFFFLTF